MKKRKKRRQNTSFRDILPTPLLIVLAGFILVAAGLFAVWRSGGAEVESVPVEVDGQPKLQVDKEMLDFGDVKVGQTVMATFTLSNVGDETLRITNEPYIEVLEGC